MAPMASSFMRRMAIVVIAFDRGFLDRPVHSLDLYIGPGMLDLGQPVLDALFVTDLVEDVVEGVFVMRHVGELDAVVGQHGMDRMRYGRDQIAQELGSDHLAGLSMQLDEGELAGAIDRHEQA